VEGVRKSIEDERERTNASLGAERASADDAAALEIRTRRRFSDVIEHDRLIVDEQLSKFRDRADQLLAGERRAAPSPAPSVAMERRAADEAMRSERDATDTILEQERQRSDDAVLTRDRRDVKSASALERRQDTDENLSTERHGVDEAVNTYGNTKQVAEIEALRHREVIGTVAHELNNPLAVIAASSQLLAESANDPEAREMAEDVVHAAARMKRLLSDLLDGVRIDTGTFRVAPAQSDIGALLREIRAAYTPLFEMRQLTFTVDMSAPTPPVLVAFDSDRIVQVLSNLLSNAMKFTPAKGRVDVHANWRADCVEVSVRDSGSGIAEEALPHVFERFWQAGTQSRIGLGLGLYICKTIIEAHGGQIGVESEPIRPAGWSGSPGGRPPGPPQIRTCRFPASYVARHIRCVMWPASKCGEAVRRTRFPGVSRQGTPHLALLRDRYKSVRKAISSRSCFQFDIAGTGVVDPERAQVASALAFISKSTSA
jgi:signal transduction histidine kinase